MRLVPLILFFVTAFLWNIGTASSQDYTQYYQSINKAEETIFVKEKLNEGLDIYVKTFSKYDFVFLHDCMTALQAALHAKNEKALLAIADKASKNGLLPRHLAKISYINKHPLYNKHKDSVLSMCKANRQHYLKRIDTAALKKMYDLFAYDQMEKNPLKGENEDVYRKRYRVQVKEIMDKLRTLITEKGWPSDKLIGVAQSDIMRELRISHPDMLDYYRRNKNDYNISESQFEIQEYYFSSCFIYPIIHHYTHYDTSLFSFDEQFYLTQIKLGNLHPKDFAGVKDWPFNTSSFRKPDLAKGEMFFGVGIRIGPAFDDIPLIISDELINKFRVKYFIVPIEVDRAKWKFAKVNKMYIGWGFNGMRS